MKTLPAPEGFKPATREEFYAVLNPSPGIGLIVNKYEKNGRGYVTHHKGGHSAMARVIAVSYSGDFPFTSDFNQRHYYLPA